MKYVIHSYVKRRWYVKNFLLPSMKKQGVNEKDVLIFEDDGTFGNLMSFVNCLKIISEVYSETMWHVQDDVILSKDFAEITNETSRSHIACGFCSVIADGENVKKTGWQSVENGWMSFQAIQIPNRYCIEFVKWFENRVIKEGLFKNRFDSRKYDDFFFWWFVVHEHKDDLVYNICPNIVNHVDNIVRDSTCNPKDIGKNVSYYWNDYELIDQLRQKVAEFRKRIV